MAKADEIAEIAAEGVADGLHIVSEEALAVEKVVRGIESMRIAYIGLGVAIGATVGGFVAYRVAYRKAETKFNEIAAEEIAEMRQHYADKTVALEATAGKADLEELVRGRGYIPEVEATQPPMAVTPPSAVIVRAEEVRDEAAGEPVPDVIEEASEVRNVFRDNAPPVDSWDYHEERKKRSPLAPYIIHVDERQDHDAYEDVTLTYYEADDVLCNERDEVIAKDERDKMIGEAHLEKFGHGSEDASIVYVRNNRLEIDFEVVRSPNSYAEEVHGFDPEPPEIRHADRRARTSDDDE